ncbi:hypothetical protein H4582DRAFT_2078373 [Lactarius indigo]|nr:hypothetical protein H4582DRAFT_2078373 [Lactarius indigo]
MVNTPLPTFQKTSSNNNNGQTVDLVAAKLNYLYGSRNVPRLYGPDKFRRPSKGHIHDNGSGSNNDEGAQDFEVVRRKMGIDDQTAPPPLPAPQSSGGPGSTGSGGGLSSA